MLAEHDVIDETLAAKLGGWAGLRNIVVHLYLDLDHRLVLSILRSDLDELVELAQAISATMDGG